MTKLRSMVLVTIAVVTTACAPMTSGAHLQHALDVARYHTFDWGPAGALPAGDPQLDRNPFFRDHLEGAVEKHLAMHGFERVQSGTPDLLVHYHASITSRIDVNRIDREYGYCYDATCESRVFDYEAGTLVLDFVDPRTNRVIFRGWAQSAVKPMPNDRDVMATRINEAVAQMLERFPRSM